MKTAFGNHTPRRGTAADAALRRHFLKEARTRQPRKADIEKLRRQAQREMARSNALRGVDPEGRAACAQ